MRRWFTSLTVKLLAIYLTLLVVSGFILFWILEYRAFVADREGLVSNLKNVVAIQSGPIEVALWEVNVDETQKIVSAIGTLEQIEHVVVRGPDGQVLASAGNTDVQPARPEYQVTRTLVFKNEAFEEHLGSLVITVHDRGIRNVFVQRLTDDAVVLIVMFIAIGLGTIVTTNLLIGRPLSRMLRSIDKFERENVREQVDWQSSDELGQVIEAYNEMQSSQAKAEEALRTARDELELRVKERTEELARSVAELRALGEVSQAVSSTLDLETVLNTIVAKAVQLSGTEAGAIYAFNDASGKFLPSATYGMSEELIAAITNLDVVVSDAVRHLAKRSHPVQVADLEDEPYSPTNDIMLRAGFRARLAVPLLGAERAVGALVVRRKAPGEFPKGAIELLQTFAAQSVLAIENANLFQELKEKGRQLQLASQKKSQFLANMSHELRTPLNAIIGYSEILQEDVKELGQEQLALDLKKIESAGRHLLGLINDILDLSKIEAGRMDVFLEDVEIGPLLDEVRSIITPLTEKNANTLDFRLSPKLGDMRTDRTKVKQCLLNVLSNGNKFTQNGRITLVVERIEGVRPIVRFVISDTGIGMNEEQLGRLFQAFSQADVSTTKEFGGTGLGLFITQHFCQLLGGDIKVTSRRGEGSTFTITLPDSTLAPAQVEPVKVPRISGDVDNAITVLVVDDDPVAHDLLSAKLKGESYRLVHANNGEEALELARKFQPDAITLDVLMPKTDGWAVLSALKADSELCDIPVVMVTVVPDRGLGLSLGAVDVLTKPVDRAHLTALLRRLVRRDGPILVVEDDAGTREMVRRTV